MILITFVKVLLLLICALISVAFITLLERKVLSLIGVRVGPNKVSFLGFLQPITDAVKLSNKQINYLSNFSFFFYYSSALFMMFSGLMIWFCSFSDPSFFSFKFSMLLFFIILGINSLSSIISGWSTFSKYSLIGSIRTVAQLVSYEASLYLCLFFFIYVFFSFSFYNYMFFPFFFFLFSFPFIFLIWLPSFLSDLNRTPYDFSEGESELVSGFNTEFGSNAFTMIFLAEYSNIIFFCLLGSFIFFFSYMWFFFFFLFFFVIWIRSVLPRYRFDKLMFLCWKFYIPFLTIYFILMLMDF